MSERTKWFRVDHEPPARAGVYEVMLSWPGRHIVRMTWDGNKWLRIGKLKPSSTWGDLWRGLAAPPVSA